jgi:hypothetical protein
MNIYFVLLALSTLASGERTFTVYNNCKFPVWPGVYTQDPKTAPHVETGWKAEPGSKKSFKVPESWTSGRIWGRTNCDFKNGQGSCLTGNCAGGLHCTAPGAPPATLAEFTLSAGQTLVDTQEFVDASLAEGLSLPMKIAQYFMGSDPEEENADQKDFLDVSVVDGFNIPMKIANNKDCGVPSCPANLNAHCPSKLVGPKSPSGKTLGCNSDCLVDPNKANSPSCCTGSHSTPDKCPKKGVPHYQYFKKNCRNSYVYAYDEKSGTALWTCPASKKADYTITFCP